MLENRTPVTVGHCDRYAVEYPLSYAQSRLWFLDKFTSGNPFYNLPLVVHLPATLNRKALGLALNEVVRRHETLRCCIREGRNEPSVVVNPFEPFPVPFTDLSLLSRKEHDAQLAEITTREAGQPFNLNQTPLTRYRLVRLTGGSYLFLVTMHHIISDGWSMGVFWRELTTLYADASAGRRPSLPELDLQYGDYAIWQREQSSGGALQTQRVFWIQQLAGMEQLNLLTDFPRPSVPRHRGATYSFSFSTAFSREITAMAQRCGTTPFAVLLAGLAVILGRYADQTDIVIGTPVANRGQEELEGMIGFFVNSVVLRINLAGTPDFEEVIRRTGRTVADALYNSEYPFERLVDDLEVARDPSRNPLFQVTAQLFVGPGSRTPTRTDVTGSIVESNGIVTIDKGTALFDMAWNYWFESEAIRGQVEFDTDLFDPRTVAGMARAFEILLSAAFKTPKTRVRNLPLVTRQVTPELSTLSGETSSVPDLWTQIKRRATEEANRVLVEFGDVTLTGSELLRKVETIAAGLQECGIGPENLVALNIDKSDRLVMAVLAVLAVGAAFMPLNLENPSARNVQILSQTKCTLVICDSVDEENATAHRSVTLDALAALGKNFTPVPPSAACHLAYVILTSGSTGIPRAVAQTYGAIANQIDWLMRRLMPKPDDAILFKTPLVFDASLWELLLPLYSGFRLVVAPPETYRDPRRIVSEVTKRRITMLQLVPSMMRLVLEDLYITHCTDLRLMCAGGEALDAGLVALVKDALPTCSLLNLYGPAETCVQSAIGSMEEGGDPVFLNEAADRNSLYLLGPMLEPVPDGHQGELWIGGIGVARCYLYDPERTAERFVPDPFAADGSRMYRTGDRFIRRADGALDYKGRLDGQIKRSGIRIELGEIEAALLAHADVSRAAALIHDGIFLAYAETGSTEVELRRHLRARLPKQLLPDKVVPIAAFPLLVSGKTDRIALRAIRPPEEAVFSVEPRSKVDEAVATIWADVLNRDTVPINQDFFSDLGGHSLLAIRAVVSMRNLLGIEFPLHLIFDYSTVESIVDALRRNDVNAERLTIIEELLAT